MPLSVFFHLTSGTLKNCKLASSKIPDMKILIFGSTGMVGQKLIDSAITHGHEVRAFGRNVFEKLSTERDHLELFKGYLFTDSDIKKALKGVDAVLSAIGGPADGVNKTRSLGMKKIVAQMEKRGVKRIIGIGGLGILQADEDTLLMDTPDFPEKFLPVSQEHLKAYTHLKDSELDWTFVCPPNIIEAGKTDRYNINRDYPAEGLFQINAGDLAEFMVRELKDNEFNNCRVGIADKGADLDSLEE